MASRFRRSAKIGPGIRLNVGKKSASLRIGPRGAGLTISTRGRTTKSVGIPGTGLHFMSSSGPSRRSDRSRQTSGSAKTTPLTRAVVERAVPGAGFFGSKQDKAFRRGFIAYVLGEFEIARHEFEEASAHDRDNVSDDLFLGVVYHKLGRDNDAIQFLERVVQSETSLPDQFMQKFTGAFQSSMRVEIAAGVEAEAPFNSLGAALLLAELYQREGDLESAIDLLEGLGSIDAEEAAVSLSLAELHAERSDWDDVMRVTDGLTNKDDLTLGALIYRARALASKGLADAVHEVLKGALRTKKRDARLLMLARYERAKNYEVQGKAARAKKDFELIYATDPSFEDVAERLGV